MTNLNETYKGYFTALTTPMCENGDIDETCFSKLINRQISAGITGVIPAGTTGESPTLTSKEHIRVIEMCVKAVDRRIIVLAGAGSNSTREAVEFARQAETIGADSILSVVPYYNKPTQEGLYRHFMTIADAVNIPIWLYCVPGRCADDLSVETIAKLSKHPNIAGTKDATADLTRPIEVRLKAGSSFNQLSGEDGTSLSFLAAGGHGCISVTSNVAPELCVKLYNLWSSGNIKEAITLQDKLMPLHKALFLESSPTPVKYALWRMKLASSILRLPLVLPREETRKIIDQTLVDLNLLKL